MVPSALEDVAGLGDARKRLLLRHFGSLKRLRAATVEEIASLPGMGPKTAQSVYDVLHPADGQDIGESIAVDPLTGEILETASPAAVGRSIPTAGGVEGTV